MFSYLKRQGAMPSTSKKQLDKGKGKVAEQVIVEKEDEHETDQEF